MDLTLETLRQPQMFGDRPGHRLCPTATEQVAELLATQKTPLALVEQEAGDLAEPLWLDLSGLNRVRNYRVSDLMIEVETGITIKELNRVLKAQGHAFALSYPEETRLIDVLSEDRPGLETGLAGYPRDAVLKSEVVTTDGQVTHYGADVVKNVTGYDLNKLYVGSRSTLAILTAVTLKLQAAPEVRSLYLQGFDTLNKALEAAQTLLAQGLLLSQCEIFHIRRLNTHQQRQLSQPWQLLTEFSGDARTLATAIEPAVTGSGALQEKLAHAHAKAIQNQLGNWPPNELTVEMAVPAGSLEALLTNLIPEILNNVVQVRPAAGLCYLEPGASTAEQLVRMDQQARALGGFLKIAPASSADRALSETFNLPANPILRDLMRQLKKRYDPNSILYSRALPLDLRP